MITVNRHAIADFTTTSAINCAPFTIDTNIIVHNQHADVNGSYQWFANGQLIGTTASFPGYTLTHPQDSVTIKLVAISKFGCKSDSLSNKLFVVALPQPEFTMSDSAGCGPLTVSFVNQSKDTAAYQHLWNFGNGQTSSNVTPGAITFTPATKGTDTSYTVTLTVFNQCDTIAVSKVINVRSKPSATLTAAPVNGCAPLAVNFNALLTGTKSNFKIFFGDGTDSVLVNSGSFSHVYPSSSTTQVVAKLVSQNECGADTVELPIRLIVADTRLNFTIQDSAGCEPPTVTIVNRSS